MLSAAELQILLVTPPGLFVAHLPAHNLLKIPPGPQKMPLYAAFFVTPRGLNSNQMLIDLQKINHLQRFLSLNH